MEASRYSNDVQPNENILRQSDLSEVFRLLDMNEVEIYNQKSELIESLSLQSTVLLIVEILKKGKELESYSTLCQLISEKFLHQFPESSKIRRTMITGYDGVCASVGDVVRGLIEAGDGNSKIREVDFRIAKNRLNSNFPLPGDDNLGDLMRRVYEGSM